MTTFETDPDTGLKLKPLGVTPGIRIDSVYEGLGTVKPSPAAEDAAPGGPEVRNPSAQEQAQTTQPQPREGEAAPEIDGGGLLGGLLHVIRGGPEDSMLSPERRQERQSDRANAGQLAATWKNPGKNFMGPVAAGGQNDGFESIGKIVRLVKSIL